MSEAFDMFDSFEEYELLQRKAVALDWLEAHRPTFVLYSYGLSLSWVNADGNVQWAEGKTYLHAIENATRGEK